MGSPSTDSIDAWMDIAERSLYSLANDLRRVTLEKRTKRLHLRALELKREVATWRDRPPDPASCSATLEEIEELAREAQFHRKLQREERDVLRPHHLVAVSSFTKRLNPRARA